MLLLLLLLLLLLFSDDVEEFSAKCYYTCDSFLVLENLNASGFTMEDRMSGLGLDQCLLVMRTLARFHASSVILYQQDPRIFKKFDISIATELVQDKFLENFWTGNIFTLFFINRFQKYKCS